jgi:hypothetical protein
MLRIKVKETDSSKGDHHFCRKSKKWLKRHWRVAEIAIFLVNDGWKRR